MRWRIKKKIRCMVEEKYASLPLFLFDAKTRIAEKKESVRMHILVCSCHESFHPPLSCSHCDRVSDTVMHLHSHCNAVFEILAAEINR
jgi:hypothetical protein